MTKRIEFLTVDGAFLISFVVLFSCLFVFPSPAASEIYRWKDSDGNMVFSESPPSGSNAEEVRLKSNMRVERPPSRDDASKTGKSNKAAAGKKLRDASDINVVMYMTDW